MYPEVVILNKVISTYGLLAVLGAMVSINYGAFQIKKAKLPLQDYALMLGYGCIGALIGAKLLYLIPRLFEIWEFRDVIFANPINFTQYFLSGFVFYGGLIGLFLGLIVYGREFHVPVYEYVKVLIPAIPLFHAFGRIGCFLVGCCYGMEAEAPWGILTHSNIAQNPDAMRVPVQLIEAALNMILFFYLAHLNKQKYQQPKLLGLYAMSYAILRFVLEFFRGDVERGIFILSTSQWISLVLFALGWWAWKYHDQFWLTFKHLCGMDTQEIEKTKA